MSDSQPLNAKSCHCLEYTQWRREGVCHPGQTAIGQHEYMYGSSTVLQQLNDQLDQQCVSWCTHNFVWGRGALTVKECGRKIGRVLMAC